MRPIPVLFLHITRQSLNTLRPRQNGRHFADDIFKCIFMNENVWIVIENSLNFVPKGRINNIPALVQIMGWRRRGDKPLFEPMMVSLLMHTCVTRAQCVKPESHAEFIFRNINYLHYSPLLNIEMAHVVEILSHGRQGPVYPALLTLNTLNCFKDYKRYIHILNHILGLAWHK